MARKNGVAADFLTAAKSYKREKIEIDGLPVVYAKPLSAADVNALSRAHLREGKEPGDDDAYDNEALTLAIVAASLVDVRGKPVVPAARAAELRDLPNATLTALQQVALRINGMGIDQPGN